MLSRPARRAPVRRSGVGRGITARVSHTPARLESLQGGPYDRQIRRHCSVRGARPRAGRGRAVGRPRPHLGGLLLGPRVRRGGGVSAGYSAPPQPQGPEPPRAGAGGRRRSEAHRGAVDGGSGRRARLRPPHHSVPAAGRGVAGGGPRSRAAAPRGGWARGAGDPRVGANAISEAFIPAAVVSCSSVAEVTRCKPPDNAQPPTVPGTVERKPKSPCDVSERPGGVSPDDGLVDPPDRGPHPGL